MSPITAETLFAGPGEMRALCRAHDWAAGPLGPVEAWPASLRTTVQLVMGAASPMVMFWGPALVQLFNDAFRPSLGEAPRLADAVGAPGARFWAEIWDRRGPQIAHVLAGGAVVQHADTLIPMTRDGRREEVWWSYSDNPLFDDDGHICGVLVMCQETTARALAARRLTYVFQHARSFLAVLRGPDYVFEQVNAAYYQLVGYRELLGKPVLDALPEVREQGFVQALLDQVRTTGEPYVGRETSILLARTPGALPEERFIDFVYLPLVEGEDAAGSGGERVGVIAHGTDVTEQVLARRDVERLLEASERARVEAEQARAEAEAANRAKSEFLAVMSHELRTPLNAIGGYAELIELGIHGPVTDAQRTALARIQRSQRHLLGLINGVLNYAKVDAGAVQYEVSDVPLGEVLATCEALIAPQASAKRISLASAGCDIDIRARADREKVQQIVLNLLSNAVKFTEPGGRVTLGCAADGSSAILQVTDTGHGIASDQLERVFQPFVQVDARLTRTHDGTGLGLAISRDLARGMGGELTVESVPGMGSTFTLALPCA